MTPISPLYSPYIILYNEGAVAPASSEIVAALLRGAAVTAAELSKKQGLGSGLGFRA